jgi:Sec-independent protein secretion pathway component TatC
VGSFLTPGDLVWTTLAMAVPLYVLYELSIVLSAVVYRRQHKGEDDVQQKRLITA